MNLFSHELTSLGAGRLALTLVPTRALDGFLLRHSVLPSPETMQRGCHAPPGLSSIMERVRLGPRSAFQLITIAAAVAVAFAPPGARAVERWYARGLYPQLQAAATSVSNRVPVALFDVAMMVLA